MSNQKISTKKLRAIVFTDIVNFTQLSAKDEQAALDLIQKQNKITKIFFIFKYTKQKSLYKRGFLIHLNY